MVHLMNRLGHNLFAVIVLACAILFVHAARAEEGIYTTKTEETTTTGIDADGNAFETTTETTYKSPWTIDAENRESAWENDPNAEQFPYDSTGGANRSDIDTARQGFDDPRNPWDGRYSNDSPANHDNNAVENDLRLKGADRSAYAPGNFGTK